MTIDEATKYMKLFRGEWDENSKTKNAEALDVAIKALEELKEYKVKEFQCHLAREEGISIGYNKAIDDFAEKLSDVCLEESMKVVFEDRIKADILTLDGVTELIWDIAEQLKAGGIDG